MFEKQLEKWGVYMKSLEKSYIATRYFRTYIEDLGNLTKKRTKYIDLDFWKNKVVLLSMVSILIKYILLIMNTYILNNKDCTLIVINE